MAQTTHTGDIGPVGMPVSGWARRTVESARRALMPSDDDSLTGAFAPEGASARRSGPAAVLLRLLPRLVLLGAVGLLALAVLLFGFRALYADKVYPAVAVGDVPVGGLTLDGAVAEVERRAAELETGTVVFSYGGQEWRPTLAELGAVVDVDGSVEAAYALGRDDNTMGRLGFTNALVREDQGVPLRTVVDRGVLGAWFDRVDGELGQRAVDAELVIAGTAVRIEPERIGTVVDREAAEAAVLGALGRLEPVVIELPTQLEQPNIFTPDLQEAEAQIAQAFNTPLVAQFEGTTFDLDTSVLAGFLTVETTFDGQARTEMTMDTNGLTTWLRDTYASQVNRAPSDATIAWSSGEGLIATSPSVDGAALRSNAFAEAVSASFLSDQAPVEIPVVVTKPAIDANNLAALKIDSLLARGDSNYGGQKQARDTNIDVATSLLSGTLIAPGEEFSFNGAIGTITQDKGYVESGAIINGRASSADGGGVCQVSTTVFRAAVLGGFPITDWAEHTQRLGVYERDGWTAGFDSSILQWGDDPSLWGDLKFRNDTGGYMLIQSWNDYPFNIVEIYGHDDGRQVDVSNPQVWEADTYPPNRRIVDESLAPGTMIQVEWPRLPTEAMFTVTTTYADGTVNAQEFYSQYVGSGNIYTVSPDMAG